MKRYVLLFLLAALVPLHADTLGGAIKISPVSGWMREESLAPGQEEPLFPTLRYVPKDGRNAAIILTLLPNDMPGLTISNAVALARFNLLLAQPYLANPEDTPPFTELEIPNGIAVCITNEDPALIGKPVPPGEYRIATSACVLLDRKYVIHCTIFYDEMDSAELRQALKILLSATVKTFTTSVPSSVI